MPPVSAGPAESSAIQQWMQDQRTLTELNRLKTAKQQELDEIAAKIRETMKSVRRYNPDLGEESMVVRPARQIDPNDSRPFHISIGRSVREAKSAGFAREKAREYARGRLQNLATNDVYKLEKPPKAAFDRIEQQLDLIYGKE